MKIKLFIPLLLPGCIAGCSQKPATVAVAPTARPVPAHVAAAGPTVAPQAGQLSTVPLPQAPPTAIPPKRSHLVEYKVFTTNGAMVAYTNAQGGTEQITESPAIYTKAFRATAGTTLFLSAQSKADFGHVTIRIDVDGKIAKESRCEGAYCIATAQGRL